MIYLQDEFSFYIEGPYSLPNYFEGDIIEGIYIQYNNIYFNSVVLGSVDFIGDIYYKISLTKESALTYLPMETYDILNGAIITGKNIFVECKIDNINTFYRSGGQFGAAGIIFTSSDPNCEGRDASVVLKRKDWGGIVGWINPDNVINKNIIKFIKDGNSYIAQQDFSLSEKANFYFEFECWTCNLQEGQQDVVTPDSEEACKIIKKPYWTDINRKKIASAKDKTEIRFNVEGIGLFCDKFQVELWKESANGKLEIYDDSLSGVFTFLNNKGEIKYTLDKKKIRGALGSSYNLFFRIKYGKDFSNTIDSEKIKFR